MSLSLEQCNEFDRLSFLRRVTSKKNQLLYCIEGTRVFLHIVYQYRTDSYERVWFYKAKNRFKKKYITYTNFEEILNSKLIGPKNKEHLLFNIDLLS